MKVVTLLGALLSAQLAVSGTLRVIGRIDAEESKYLQKAAPGELSADITIRVLALNEDSYSTCFPAQGALCQVREERGSGPVKILIESEGYEPYSLSIPKVVFGENNITPVNIGTVRLKEAPRPRLVQIVAGLASPQNYRFSLTMRNPGRQPFSLRRVSVLAKRDRWSRSPCDDRRYPTYKFSRQVRIIGAAGELKNVDQDLMHSPGAADRLVEMTGSIAHHCGDEILNIDAALDISLPADVLTTLQIEMPAVILVERPGVSQPGDRPLEPWNVEPEHFNSYSFRLTSIRTDVSSQSDVTEVLLREYTVPRERPFDVPTRRKPGPH